MSSRPLTFLYASSCLLLGTTHGQVFVGTNRSETEFPYLIQPPDGISGNCNSTFASEVTCDVNLPVIASGGYFPSNDDLTNLCNLDCLRSLESFRSTQEQSCAADVMVVSGFTYNVTTTTDTLLWTYNFTCRRDPTSGDFCAPIFDAWANGDTSKDSCSDCILGVYQVQLSNFLGYDDNHASAFSSLTVSCQATGYPLTSPPPNYITETGTPTTTTVASPTASKACASTYTVQDGDDCHSISQTEGISTSEMLYLNNLQAGCTDFPGPGTSLCMPHTCEVYTVQPNDTCWGIVESHDYSFTISQLVSWNIDISRGCDNLELLSGIQICVSYPGSIPEITATAPASTATLAPIPTDVVDGTNTRCGKYYRVRAGDICESVTQIAGISLADFYFLNPEVNSTTCANLLLGYSYCVQAVGDIATYPGYGGSPTNPCVGGTKAPDTSCYATTYATADPWTFPVVNTTSGGATTSNYTSLPVETVAPFPTSGHANPTPVPHQSGMVDGCARFYYVVANDGCLDIANRWGVPLDTLYAWNPDLHTDCTGLQLGTYICVGLGDGAGSSVVTATPT
ncbi:uncharacterized protein GGS22DRAFT_10196 [Annulohypoxylon maeteangense]|uniref:uncharacterized protein n=1 Tax=Annulohypoxylon maeteangense TaxID=1927788 RepID=UPI002008A48B|nr:uncharacterized protein GGS22DRAFT_10196 [Annulohypoxylon maeteangense]KAI0890231.1 hypothetical protein GGS22DRAFT_10196 [Annulohypoxylon maeteangense]